MAEKTMEWKTVQILRGVNAMAKRLGYSHTHLIRVMRGERKPSKELVRKLGRLGITVPDTK